MKNCANTNLDKTIKTIAMCAVSLNFSISIRARSVHPFPKKIFAKIHLSAVPSPGRVDL